MATLFDDKALNAKPEFFIHIIPDKTNKTLSIIDSGIGMTKGDLLGKLGSFSSVDRQETYIIGTENFKAAAALGTDVPCVDRLKKYCLGFFSVFLVADQVKVTTKHNSDEQYVWEPHTPTGAYDGFFTIARDTSVDSFLGRGTQVTLWLKEDHLEYLDECRLKNLVDHYSSINYPISILAGNNAGIEKGRLEKRKHEEERLRRNFVINQRQRWTKQMIEEEERRVEEMLKKFEIQSKKEKNREKKKKRRLNKTFEGLRKRFEDVLSGRVEKVIVADRAFEFNTFMTVDFVFSINPNNLTMKCLRKRLEVNGDDDKSIINFIKMSYECWYWIIFKHDCDHGTSFVPTKYLREYGLFSKCLSLL